MILWIFLCPDASYPNTSLYRASWWSCCHGSLGTNTCTYSMVLFVLWTLEVTCMNHSVLSYGPFWDTDNLWSQGIWIKEYPLYLYFKVQVSGCLKIPGIFTKGTMFVFVSRIEAVSLSKKKAVGNMLVMGSQFRCPVTISSFERGGFWDDSLLQRLWSLIAQQTDCVLSA